MKIKRLQIVIPKDSGELYTKNIKEKAKTLGMNKSKFMLEAATFMMSIDDGILRKAKDSSKRNYLPLWLNLKNILEEGDLCSTKRGQVQEN